MDKEQDIVKDLEPSSGDYAHAGVRAGLSVIPCVGGPLTEFFSMVIAPPLEQRRDAWMIEIFTRLKMLEGRVDGFRIENLAQNKNFISTFFYATQAAMRTHQQEKLEALRNVVINSAKCSSINENMQFIFLTLVDRYSPLHLKLLTLFTEPKNYRYIKKTQMSFPDYYLDAPYLIENVPELDKRPDLLKLIMNELQSDGLLQTKELQGRQYVEHRVSPFGMEFLNFITTST